MPKPNDVGVGTMVALVDDSGRILMIRRKGAHAAGLWSCPGGWLDRSDQSLLAGVQREALEEVGITIHSAHQVGATTEDHPDLGIRSVTICFVSRSWEWSGTPVNREPEKCAELKWFSRTGYPDNLFPALPEALWMVWDYMARNPRWT